MSSIDTATQTERQKDSDQDWAVNDFSLQVATINGSGSQSSNSVLMRSIFQMGIPVSGKNLFPSNIAGLPTWFTIRASKDGYTARKKELDILIAMNPETGRADVEALEPGCTVIYEEKLRLSSIRDDLIYYAVPFSKLAAEIVKDVRLRKLVANMIYVGAAAELFSIPMAQVESAIGKLFKSKAKAAEINIKAAHIGAQYVRDNLEKKDRFKVAPMEATQGKIIIDGNSASALGCAFGGATVVTWYPITPSSSLCESFIGYAERFRMDPDTGKATFAIVQAEDELAALGMAIGAGWAGARSMTATSGPGISLMAEFAGLAYFAEIPCVIFDVQRVGPSTGLPTRTLQGDINSLFYLSHGDTKHFVLFPCDMNECFEFAQAAFDLTERMQQPVFVALDLDLGMNNWMSDPFTYPDKPFDRGKVLTAEDLESFDDFGRYKDQDGDGIPYRTLPNTPHPRAPFFTRGSGRNEYARYSESPEDFEDQLDRLSKKFETGKQYVPEPVIETVEGARIGIIAYGSSDLCMLECLDQLQVEYGTDVDYFRLRALPFTPHLRQFVEEHDAVYVVEQNRDGQMADLVRLEVGEEIGKIHNICHYNGLPLDARTVSDSVAEHQELKRI